MLNQRSQECVDCVSRRRFGLTEALVRAGAAQKHGTTHSWQHSISYSSIP